MAATLKQRTKQLPAKRRVKVEKRAQELIAEEMTLKDLRRALDLTQERMAEMLDIGQDSVSRLEKRSDLLLSTLRSYVAAMGGSLELVARFPDRPPVIVSGLTSLEAEKRPQVGKAVRSDGRRAKRPSTA
jgi:transcriptional regulator with XRE-family HTH domain